MMVVAHNADDGQASGPHCSDVVRASTVRQSYEIRAAQDGLSLWD
jgi:hypothetical protein